MEVKLVRSRAPTLDADAVVVLECGGQPNVPNLRSRSRRLYEFRRDQGKPLEFTLLHGLEGYKARRVLIAGAGKRGEIRTGSAAKNRRRRRALSEGQRRHGSDRFRARRRPDAAAQRRGRRRRRILGAWEPDYLKDRQEEKPQGHLRPESIAAGSGSALWTPRWNAGALSAEARICRARYLCRTAQSAHPDWLARASRARKMAEPAGLSFEVLDQDRMRQLGMGALLGWRRAAPRRRP